MLNSTQTLSVPKKKKDVTRGNQKGRRNQDEGRQKIMSMENCFVKNVELLISLIKKIQQEGYCIRVTTSTQEGILGLSDSNRAR